MAEQFDALDEELTRFIESQRIFFTGTAAPDGRVNVSPKGMDSLRVVGPNELLWLNLTGSGNETAAHLRAANRVTMMWCAFEGDPNIVRVYGTGSFVESDDGGFDELLAQFDLADDTVASVRAIITVDVEFATDSCGYVVPEMTQTARRDKLFTTADKLIEVNGETAIRQYTDRKNATSIDGLPGLPSAQS